MMRIERDGKALPRIWKQGEGAGLDSEVGCLAIVSILVAKSRCKTDG